MKRLISAFILVFFIPLSVSAGIDPEFDRVEEELIQQMEDQKQHIREDVLKDVEQKPLEPMKTEEVKSGSSWWKWVLGIVLVGGIAAAAAGGGGGGGDSSSSSGTTSGDTGNTGTVTVSW